MRIVRRTLAEAMGFSDSAPLWQSLTLRSVVTGNTLEVVMPENATRATVETEEDLVTETLIEEVSIDGMCGVY